MAGRMSLHCHRNKLQVGVETTLLLLLSYVTGSACNKVVVPEHVNAVLGKNITLGCKVEVEANLSLTQISWERKLALGTTTLAVFNPQFGISIPQEYAWRLSFRSPSTHDGTIVLGDVGFADAGIYVCKVATFPLGNTQSSTVVTVIVEPKVYVSAGSEVLLDGGNETSVATCTAERARPPAEVSWESPLYGHSEVLQRDEADGTTTTAAHYTWRPTRHAQDHALTCVVRHPALPTEFRILYRLNVQFAPDVTVAPSDGDWFVGRQRSQLQCRASANPPVLRYRWSRLGKTLPEGVEVANGTLLFMRPLELNDSGIYSCEAENDVGVRSQEALVRVREPPSTPALTSYPTATPSSKQRAQLSSPTQASPPDGHLGSIVGGVVGGVLFLVLLLVLGVACYTRRRRTFRGDYYTKQYLGPADMQRESQLDVLQPHELQEVYGGRADPRPRSDCTSEQKDREEWGGSVDGGRRIHKEEAYHLNHLSPRGTYSNNNGVPYVPEERYDNSTDSDYVSHLDGSVISRREWYV